MEPSAKLWWQLSNSELNAETADNMLGASLRSTIKAPQYHDPPRATGNQQGLLNATVNWADGVMDTNSSLGASMTCNEMFVKKSSYGTTGHKNSRQEDTSMVNDVSGLVGAAAAKRKTSMWGSNMRSDTVPPPPLSSDLSSTREDCVDLLAMNAATTTRGMGKIIQRDQTVQVNSSSNLKVSPNPEKEVSDDDERAMALLRGLTTSGDDAVVRQSDDKIQRINLGEKGVEAGAGLGGSNNGTSRRQTFRKESLHAAIHNEPPKPVSSVPAVVATTKNEVTTRRISASGVDAPTSQAAAERDLVNIRGLPVGKDERSISKGSMGKEEGGVGHSTWNVASPRPSEQKALSFPGELVVDKGTGESNAYGTAKESVIYFTPNQERRERPEPRMSLGIFSAGSEKERNPSSDQSTPTESPHSGKNLKVPEKLTQQIGEPNPTAERDPTENSKPKVKKNKRQQGKREAWLDVVAKSVVSKSTAPKRSETERCEPTSHEHGSMVNRSPSPGSRSSSGTTPRSKAMTQSRKKKQRNRSSSPIGIGKIGSTPDPAVSVASAEERKKTNREQEEQSHKSHRESHNVTERTASTATEPPPDPMEADSMLAVLAGLSLELKRRRRREQRRRTAGGGEGAEDCHRGRIMYARAFTGSKSEGGTTAAADSESKMEGEPGERRRLEERVSALETAVTSSGIVQQNIAPTRRCVGCFRVKDR